MIAAEVIGIDIDMLDDASQPQLHDTPVVPWVAASSRFPSIHPLAMVRVFIRNENSAPWFEQILLFGEEFIVRAQDGPADPLGSEINKPGGGSDYRIGWLHEIVVRVLAPSI